MLRRQLVGSTRAGESVTRVAERLLDIDDPVVRLPRHVKELRDAARFAKHLGDSNLYEVEVAKWQGRIGRLGQGAAREAGAYTARSATQALVKDLRAAKLAQVDHVVDRWVLERARHQARVVARTEIVEGFRESYRSSTKSKPYVKGYRWTLSNAHPRPDICDVLAGQDLHGLGPGGYPASALPSTPHPHDLCAQVAIVDTAHFRRKRAKLQGKQEPPSPWLSGRKETSAQWLRAKPEAFQRQLLGPTRHRAFLRGDEVFEPGGAQLRPVHEVLGIPKPIRKPGPAVSATPLVKADRATFVEPFPEVKPVPPTGDGTPPPGAAAAAKQAQADAAVAAKKAQQAADAAAQAKAAKALAAKQAAAEAAKKAAAEKIAKAKAELAAKKAAQVEARKAAAAEEKQGLEVLVNNGADPKVTLTSLKKFALEDPQVFGQLYDDVVKGGKGLGEKFFANLKKEHSKHAKKILEKLGFEFTPATPKWNKPYPKPAPAPIEILDFKVVDGNGFKWHDIHAPNGDKLGFIKEIGDDWVVDPPPQLKEKGWDKLTWPKDSPGAKATATDYGLEVSKALNAAKKVVTPSPSVVPAAGVSKAAAHRAAVSGWSKAWKGLRKVLPGKRPAADLKKRFMADRAGAAVAGDGDWIEDFSIGFQREVVDGREQLVARFKVTQHRAAALRRKVEEIGGRPSNFRFRGLDGLQHGELTKGALQREAPGIKTALRVEVDGAEIWVFEGTSSSERVAAMHNAVEVRLPVQADPAKGYQAFAKAMDALGVDVSKGPAPAQLRAWKQAKVLNATSLQGTQALSAARSRSPAAVEKVWKQYATPELEELLQDIELREVSAGHVTAYSPKLAQRMKDAGVSHLTHASSADAAELLEQVLVKDRQTALVSSRERYSRGVFTRGMSTEQDFQTGGADSVFTRIATGPTSGGSLMFEIDPAELGRLDYYGYNGDFYGKTGNAFAGSRMRLEEIERRARERSFSSNNEVMFRHSVSQSSIRRIRVRGRTERDKVLNMLRSNGVEQVNGIPVEDLIQE